MLLISRKSHDSVSLASASHYLLRVLISTATAAKAVSLLLFIFSY